MRKNSGRLATIVALSLASTALAQAPAASQSVQIGRVTQGRLTGAEARNPLRLTAGQTVRITVRGRDFDAKMKIFGPTGTESLAEDDDSGGGTVAELTFTAERAGLYQIAVSEAVASDPAPGGHAYDLTVVAAPTPVLAPSRPIAPNGDQPTPVDMAQCGAGCRFTFQATEGDRLIAETSRDDAAADPVLELSMNGQKLAENDDGGQGVNARIVRRIDRTGTYTLLAKTLSGKGTFALAVSVRQPVVRPSIPVVVGTPATGRIGADAQMTDEGRFYDSYTLHGRAGERVVMDLESGDFDAELQVYGDTVLGTTQLAMNDDADPEAASHSRPQTLNSHLVITFAKEGTVEVRAVSLNDPGAYTLRIADQPAS